MTKNRTEVADIDRSLYDFRYGEEGFERLTPASRPISCARSAPKGRAAVDARPALKVPRDLQPLPGSDVGPLHRGPGHGSHRDLRRPTPTKSIDWESVPDDIKDTFERLGIPEAERSYLAGVGAQYDPSSSTTTCRTPPPRWASSTRHRGGPAGPRVEAIIHEKFMTLIPPTDHKFAALHGAVWSGGSFVYVPKGVKLDFPLQSYFRLNAKGAGQFEHTLIIPRTMPTCTLSRVAPHPSTTWPTCMRALSSSSWVSARTCGTRPSRTGRRTCTT